jgi:hypothetical protein
MNDGITPERQAYEASITEKASKQSTKPELSSPDPSGLKAEKTGSNPTRVIAIAIAIVLLVFGTMLEMDGMDVRYAVLRLVLLVLLGVGLLLFVGAVFGPDAMVQDPRAIAWSERIRHDGMRVLYVVLGLALAALGAGLLWQGFTAR